MVVGEQGASGLPLLVEGDSNHLLEPWLLSENDIQWLIFLGKKRYGERFDYVTVEGWFRNIVLKSPLMFLPDRKSVV